MNGFNTCSFFSQGFLHEGDMTKNDNNNSRVRTDRMKRTGSRKLNPRMLLLLTGLLAASETVLPLLLPSACGEAAWCVTKSASTGQFLLLVRVVGWRAKGTDWMSRSSARWAVSVKLD